MSQWMGMDGGFLRRKNTGLDNYTYPKSTAKFLPSKNEAWLPHPRMINGETDMFWGSFSSKTLRSLTNLKWWYWNHNWTVNRGVSIKLGTRWNPLKHGGWGPTNTGKHWFEPRLMGGFIICCSYISMSCELYRLYIQYIQITSNYCVYIYTYWVNYSDLTATSLESLLIREIIPKWP